jgi:hypothetical protein
MKKLIAVLVIFFAVLGQSYAAIGDVWCAGGDTNGWCFNAAGNIVPFTASSQNIGTSGYKVGTMYVKDANVYGLMTLVSGSTLTVDSASVLDISDTPTFQDLTVTYGVNAATGVYSGAVSMTALTATSGAFSTTLNVTGNVIQGAANYKSTFTAASGNLDLTGNLVSLGNVTSVDVTSTDDVIVGDDLNVTGLATVGETATILGNTYIGAANYKSTFTAASGDLALTGDITVGDDAIVTGDLTLAPSTAYTSTFTASNGNLALAGALYVAGAVTGPTSITASKFTASGTGQVLLGLATSAELLDLVPGAAKGAVICNSTLNMLCQSTGTAAGAWVASTNTAVACW